MPAAQRPNSFTLNCTGWKPWSGLATEVACRLDHLRPGTGFAAPKSEKRGLDCGEQALATAAVARNLGCAHLVATAGSFATKSLRRPLTVQVLLEEGLPSPLTGRPGAIISAAGDLSLSPPVLTGRAIERLKSEGLDDQEIVDLILIAAMAGVTGRLTLGLGHAFTP